MSEYKQSGSKTSYPGKSRPTRGKDGEVSCSKREHNIYPGLGYPQEITERDYAQMAGVYKKS